jgi:predicted DCC family thiol-disulfide oxidoreductase YuxK
MINPNKFESVILIRGKNVLIKSTAALTISKSLSGPIKILYPLIFLPEFFRDFIYSLVAKSRYKIFGKRDDCRVPTGAEKDKFL